MYKLDSRLRLAGLVVGSMFPDLEIPLLVLYFDVPFNRLVLHSIVGAITLGTLCSTIFTAWIYPHIISPSFAKTREGTIKEQCRLSGSLIISCLLGNVSHALLDTINHLYNPIFWPFQSLTYSPLQSLIGWRHFLPLSLSLIAIIIHHRKHLLSMLIG